MMTPRTGISGTELRGERQEERRRDLHAGGLSEQPGAPIVDAYPGFRWYFDGHYSRIDIGEVLIEKR